jgi:hypothetical protein
MPAGPSTDMTGQPCTPLRSTWAFTFWPAVASNSTKETVPEPPSLSVTGEAPIDVRVDAVTAVAANGGGATTRSPLLVAEPAGVSTTILPDEVDGTMMVREVALALVTCANGPSTNTLLKAVSKFVPVMVRVAPGVAMLGVEVPVVKLVMVGAAGDPTKNENDVTAVPEGALTEIGPVVAPAGTATVIEVALTALGDAEIPLKLTEVLDVLPKAVPEMVTVVPTGPDLGETWSTTNVESGFLTIDAILPD